VPRLKGKRQQRVPVVRPSLSIPVKVVKVGPKNSRVSADGVAAATFLVPNVQLRTLPDLQRLAITENGVIYRYTGAIPEGFEFVWDGVAELVCTDSHNIWRNVNPWLDPQMCEGHDLFVEVEGSKSVFKFVPFEREGRNQGGMKICPEQKRSLEDQTDRSSGSNRRRFQSQYKFIAHVLS
jgi:hypothetical protein